MWIIFGRPFVHFAQNIRLWFLFEFIDFIEIRLIFNAWNWNAYGWNVIHLIEHWTWDSRWVVTQSKLFRIITIIMFNVHKSNYISYSTTLNNWMCRKLNVNDRSEKMIIVNCNSKMSNVTFVIKLNGIVVGLSENWCFEIVVLFRLDFEIRSLSKCCWWWRKSGWRTWSCIDQQRNKRKFYALISNECSSVSVIQWDQRALRVSD